MTEKEFFIETLKSELPAFERVLKAMEKIPSGKHSYKHDEKSRTAFELAFQTLGAESAMIPVFLTTGKLDFSAQPKPKWKTIKAIREAFTKNMNETLKLAQKMDQKQWGSKSAMYMGGKTEADWASTKGKMAWGFLLDLIHHRGQLSTYLRPMGGKVPSIYGPSADMK
jgi:uncharacterized damage-inducible protein DinB